LFDYFQLARGYHVKLDLVDEFDFAPETFINKVMIGKLRMVGTIFIGATTINPVREKSHVRRFQSVKDENGNCIFNVKYMGLPCRRCRKGEKPWLCNHNPAETPSWQTNERASKWSRSLENTNDEGSMAVEWSSITDGPDPNRFFYDLLILQFSNRRLFVASMYDQAEIVTVGIDTAGFSSAYGISALAKYGSQWSVCFLW